MSWWQKMFSLLSRKRPPPAVTSEQPIFAFQRRIAYQSSDELAQRLQASESAVKVYVDRVMQAANDFWKKQERGAGRLVTLVVAAETRSASTLLAGERTERTGPGANSRVVRVTVSGAASVGGQRACGVRYSGDALGRDRPRRELADAPARMGQGVVSV
jgi:hypothetical protein